MCRRTGSGRDSQRSIISLDPTSSTGPENNSAMSLATIARKRRLPDATNRATARSNSEVAASTSPSRPAVKLYSSHLPSDARHDHTPGSSSRPVLQEHLLRLMMAFFPCKDQTRVPHHAGVHIRPGSQQKLGHLGPLLAEHGVPK